MAIEQRTVLFRCDGSARTGLGHVSRCLALAEALAECGFPCRFLGRFEAGAEELLARAGMAFVQAGQLAGSGNDAAHTLQAIGDCRARLAVLDSYDVDDSYVAALHRGVPVLVIDDFGRLRRYPCSAVLNFTVNGPNLPYPRGKQLYLLGPGYLLVRRRLRLARDRAAPRSGNVRRLLVAAGGSDPVDLSRLVVRALLETAPRLSVHAVVGRSYRHPEELSGLVERFDCESQVISQRADLAEEFEWADACVCGGGLTKYEAAYLGIPTAVLSQNADQAHETLHFAEKGLAFDLGLGERQTVAGLARRLDGWLADDRRRECLSQTGLALFPEDPTLRAAEALTQLAGQRS